MDQYSKFTIHKPDGTLLHVNGKLTLGENIADAGGVNAAFAAWKQKEATKPDQILPGLQHFTKEQLFFISYSSFWCGSVRPDFAVNLIYRDAHSPTWARILVRCVTQIQKYGCEAHRNGRVPWPTRLTSGRHSAVPSKSQPASFGKVCVYRDKVQHLVSQLYNTVRSLVEWIIS